MVEHSPRHTGRERAMWQDEPYSGRPDSDAEPCANTDLTKGLNRQADFCRTAICTNLGSA